VCVCVGHVILKRKCIFKTLFYYMLIWKNELKQTE